MLKQLQSSREFSEVIPSPPCYICNRTPISKATLKVNLQSGFSDDVRINNKTTNFQKINKLCLQIEETRNIKVMPLHMGYILVEQICNYSQEILTKIIFPSGQILFAMLETTFCYTKYKIILKRYLKKNIFPVVTFCLPCWRNTCFFYYFS